MRFQSFHSSVPRLAALMLALSFSYSSMRASEGMWIPSMISTMLANDMQAAGMRISPEQLYNLNGACIRDAVVHFDGGCTGVLVSAEGLLLTNHHCGYSDIQQHSTVEHNYLRDGFWAMNRGAELMNNNTTASIVKEIRDVSTDVLAALAAPVAETQRAVLVKKVSDELVAKALDGAPLGRKAFVRSFDYGNQFLLFLVDTYLDVRLVGAPPSSIGKFGFDTDNWVWPRHTGDFSVFRVYADASNRPAAPSADNVAFKPDYFLPVNMDGVNEGDFTLVYGFPGRTDNHLSSEATRQLVEEINPFRIAMREASLAAIGNGMRQSEQLAIAYAAKQSSISNAYKKWIGQNKGLLRHQTLAKKDSLEQAFLQKAKSCGVPCSSAIALPMALATNQMLMLPSTMGREAFFEFFYMGPEVLSYAASFSKAIELLRQGEDGASELTAFLESKRITANFYKNFSAEVDQNIMLKQLPIVQQALQKHQSFSLTPNLDPSKPLESYVRQIYAQSLFASEEKMKATLQNFNKGVAKKIESDPIYQMATTLRNHYVNEVQPKLLVKNAKNDSLMREWIAAKQRILGDGPAFPDANSTLRITYGKVEGYEPFDGAQYDYYTTLEGVMEKENPDSEEFEVPNRLKELYASRDYGRYAHPTGELRVAFTASNHTSGGNSGSPVINAHGQLIGLNFDRTWESTMSDVAFNPKICRNITVDIRYVLFIIDKFAGATHLVNEMKLESTPIGG